MPLLLIKFIDKFEKIHIILEVQTKMIDVVLDDIGFGIVNAQEVYELLAQCAGGQANKIDKILAGPNKEGNQRKLRINNLINIINMLYKRISREFWFKL